MRYLIALLFAVFGMGGSLKAAESCEACTPQEMFSVGHRAVVKIAWNRPHPPVYVTNFADGLIIKVGYANNVHGNFNWEHDLFEAWGVNLPVEPQVLDYMSAMHAALPAPIYLSPRAHAATNGLSTPTTVGIPDTVYETLSTHRYDQAITAEIQGSTAGLRQRFTDYLLAINPFPYFNPRAAQPAVRVNFADGTYAYYQWDITLQHWNRIAARDKFGNRIPEDVNAVAGEGGHKYYDFYGGASTELTKFLYRLHELGVSVTHAGGAGSRTRVACTSANKGPPVCKIVAF